MTVSESIKLKLTYSTISLLEKQNALQSCDTLHAKKLKLRLCSHFFLINATAYPQNDLFRDENFQSVCGEMKPQTDFIILLDIYRR